MELLLHDIVLAYNMVMSLPPTFILLLIAAIVFIVAMGVQLYIALTPEKRKNFSNHFSDFQPLKSVLDPDNTIVMILSLHDSTRIHDLYIKDYRTLNKHLHSFALSIANIVDNNNGIIKKNSDNNIVIYWNNYTSGDNITTCAISVLDKINKLNSELSRDGLLPLNFGIGISCSNTKNLDSIIHTTVILEEKTKKYNVTIVVDSDGFNAIDNNSLLELDLIVNPYKTYLYTILDANNVEPVISKLQHDKFLQAYRDKRYDMAMTIGSSLKTAWNGVLANYYTVMIARCKYLKTNGIEYDK